MSVIDSLGNIWITPSGRDKGSLRPDEIVCVAPDGTFEGALKPSVEYPLHHAVYNARPDIRAVIHAHPPMLTSFSIVHRIPDTSVIREWREICGTAGYAGYAPPGTGEMGENVTAQFIEGHNVVIMENHAAVAGGKDLAEALARLETLEYCASALHAAAVIGEIKKPEYDRNDNAELHAGSQLPRSGPGSQPREAESVVDS
jgi:L-fuculose-phosphate aldolase